MQQGVTHDVVPSRGQEGMTAARQARGQKYKEALARRTRVQIDKGRGSDLVDTCLMGDSAAAVKGTRVLWECPLAQHVSVLVAATWIADAVRKATLPSFVLVGMLLLLLLLGSQLLPLLSQA